MSSIAQLRERTQKNVAFLPEVKDHRSLEHASPELCADVDFLLRLVKQAGGPEVPMGCSAAASKHDMGVYDIRGTLLGPSSQGILLFKGLGVRVPIFVNPQMCERAAPGKDVRVLTHATDELRADREALVSCLEKPNTFRCEVRTRLTLVVVCTVLCLPEAAGAAPKCIANTPLHRVLRCQVALKAVDINGSALEFFTQDSCLALSSLISCQLHGKGAV